MAAPAQRSDAGLSLDPGAHKACYQGQDIELTGKQFSRSSCFWITAIKCCRASKSKKKLDGWESEEVASNAVEVHIHHLRKLGQQSSDPSRCRLSTGAYVRRSAVMDCRRWGWHHCGSAVHPPAAHVPTPYHLAECSSTVACWPCWRWAAPRWLASAGLAEHHRHATKSTNSSTPNRCCLPSFWPRWICAPCQAGRKSCRIARDKKSKTCSR